MIVTQRERERERGRDTGRGRSRLHAPGARRGIRSRVSRIAPWAKDRRQTPAPPRDPQFFFLITRNYFLNMYQNLSLYYSLKIMFQISELIIYWFILYHIFLWYFSYENHYLHSSSLFFSSSF